jgi:hypothetical protein
MAAVSAAASAAPNLETPWIVAHRPRRWEDVRGDASFVRRFRRELLGPAPLPPACCFRLCILHGKPGRGKTTLGELAARDCAVAEILNASDERRGEDLRARLERFLDDGARKGKGAASAASPPPPLCLLFLDEADGLGKLGQLTLLSFLENLEDKPCDGWTPRILLTCNEFGAMHPSIISRANYCTRMPRPTPKDLGDVARSIHPDIRAADLPPDVLASGDFRLLAQTLEVSTTTTTTAAAEKEGARPARESQRAPGERPARESERAPGEAAATALGRETSDAPPAPLVRLLLRDEGTAFDPRRHLPGEEHVPPELRTLQELWRQGHRADMIAVWVETLLAEFQTMPTRRYERTLAAQRQRRLAVFRDELLTCGGRVSGSALQVYGAYVRAFELATLRPPRGMPAATNKGRIRTPGVREILEAAAAQPLRLAAAAASSSASSSRSTKTPPSRR